MDLATARRTWLLRAFETPVTAPWTEGDRTWASDEARRQVGERADADTFVGERARQGLRRLGERDADLVPLLQRLDGGGWAWAAAALLVVACAVGVAADAVGREGRIHLLAPPLIALLAWNLAVYAGLAVGLLAGWIRRGPAKGGAARAAVARLLARLGDATAAARRAAGRGGGSPTVDALQRFSASWPAVAAPTWAARATATLHAAAAALALGALASLYLRGLAFEYRAGWDSTFLAPEQALALATALLGPASAATGVALPDAQAFAALRFSVGPGENAARWIHLWAATVGAVVVLPRLVLAAAAAWQARRRSASVPLPWHDPYLARLARLRSGRAPMLRVLPYRHRPAPRAQTALADQVHRACGPQATVHLLEPVPEGDEEAGVGQAVDGRGGDAWLVGLVPLAATPERETHGRFVEAVVARRTPGQPRLLLVDEAGFGARLSAADADSRRRHRRAAWQQLAADLDHVVVFVDLDAAAPSDEASDALAAALMPALG